jgi:predicted Fe-Mo cluster-binding NifX family protein
MRKRYGKLKNQIKQKQNNKDQPMIIVVTSQGAGLESQVDPRFGRTKHFVLVDTTTDKVSSHDNAQNLNATQGAGIQAAQTVARLGAEAVLTGHVGPKAFTTLQAANIAVYTGISGTVKEAIEQFKSGRFAPAAKADVQGHWA